MKFSILILCLTLSTHVLARKKSTFKYSEAVDVFEIVDNLSRWHEKREAAYQKHWMEKLELDSTDKSLLEDWGKIRVKYHKSVNSGGELFPMLSTPADFFSNAFYSSTSVGEALKKLKKKLTKEEMSFLANLFKHFQKRISSMVSQSVAFKSQVPHFEKQYKKLKYDPVLRKAKRFIEVPRWYKKNTVYFVWYPKELEAKIRAIAPYIIIYVHPDNLGKLEMYKIAEAVVQSYFDTWPSSQKESLSRRFLETCPRAKKLAPQDVMLRPISSVFGQLMVSKKKNRKGFRMRLNEMNPWVEHFALSLFPKAEGAIKRREKVHGPFWSESALHCQSLVKLSDYISSFK